MTRAAAIEVITKKPYLIGHALGFTKLTPMHNAWIVQMLRGKTDKTLQAHRGSYKTTCVSIALALIILVLPEKRTLFVRKTDADVKEVIRQVRNMLLSETFQDLSMLIHGKPLVLTVSSSTEISTSLTQDAKGTSQLVGLGMGASITGKHFDRIFTDDIVNVTDRVSKAERERTKLFYQELHNIVNRPSRIFNTGTPWHKDDAFSLMPNPERWDCYQTGLMTAEEIEAKRSLMTGSLFAANYELKHIADDDVIFSMPKYCEALEPACDGVAHIDAAYGGEDGTAFTVCKKRGDKYYVFGKLWQKSVDACMPDIQRMFAEFRCAKLYCEDNGDKGYLAKELRQIGIKTISYHEDMNKFLKITSYLKAAWGEVYFVPGTDAEYIEQILDYNENAEHDDAPDSLASVIRKQYWRKTDEAQSDIIKGLML